MALSAWALHDAWKVHFTVVSIGHSWRMGFIAQWGEKLSITMGVLKRTCNKEGYGQKRRSECKSAQHLSSVFGIALQSVPRCHCCRKEKMKTSSNMFELVSCCYPHDARHFFSFNSVLSAFLWEYCAPFDKKNQPVMLMKYFLRAKSMNQFCPSVSDPSENDKINGEEQHNT